tara:strand:+ start:1428 stop:3632 length:2205 start_codon:yes stop_codon:yes gene_type:complete
MSNYYNRQWRLPNAWNGTESNVNKQSNFSLEFDGTNYIDLGTTLDTYYKYVTTVSFSVWVNFKDLSTDVTVLGTYRSAFHMLDIRFLQSTGKLSFRVGFGADTAGEVEVISSGKIVANTWYHLAMVYDGSGSTNADKLKGYINGNQETLSFTGVIPSTTSISLIRRFEIGGNYSNKDGNKLLDGVAIFNYALSSSQVTTLYGSSSTGIGNPMSLSPAPVAYYPLGDQDSFNGSNYLVPNSSLKDYVFSFPSSGVNYIRLGSSGVNIGQQNTISIWVNFNGTIGDDMLISTYAGNWMINTHAGQNYLCYGATQGSAHYTCVTGLTYPTGWFLLTVVRNNTNFSVYFNDQLQGSNSNSNFTSDTVVGMIGSSSPGKWTHDVSNLTIFNTALPATGSNSIETLYNNGYPLTSMSGFTSLQGWWKLDASATWDSSNSWWAIPDDSTNSNTTESYGLTQANLVQSDLRFTSGYSPYALDFDGTTDYIRILPFGTGMTLSDSWSVSIWINTTTTSANKGILTSRNQSTPYDFFSFGPKTKSNGKIETWLQGIGYTELTPVINDGNWHHLTFAYDHSSTTIKVYTDNSESYSSTSYDNGTGRVLETIGAAYIGWYWIGKLSNLSVWNKQLTPSEVSEIYNEGVPSNLNNHSAYSNLVSWWQLGSNSSFNTNWTVLNEISTGSNGTSVNMTEDDIVDGVGSYANGLSSGMGGDEVVGDAPYSTANSLSVNMDVEDRVSDTPS